MILYVRGDLDFLIFFWDCFFFKSLWRLGTGAGRWDGTKWIPQLAPHNLATAPHRTHRTRVLGRKEGDRGMWMSNMGRWKGGAGSRMTEQRPKVGQIVCSMEGRNHLEPTGKRQRVRVRKAIIEKEGGRGKHRGSRSSA